MDLAAEALKWVAGVGFTAAAAAAAGYGAFQWMGKAWIENRFATRLEHFKHEQTQEIEQLRYRINALMDRTTKLHQHEFEVLPEVWNRLGIAFSAVQNFTFRLQTHPDLDSMSEPHLDDFLNGCVLRDWQKDELRTGRDRNGRYQKMIFWHKLFEVQNLHFDFHSYFISKGIFIQPQLKERIRSLSDMMYDALLERRHDAEEPVLGPGRFAKGDLFQKDGLSYLKAIEDEVQTRLWEANKLD